MKVLITGAGGQLAQWVQRCAPVEAETVPLSRGQLDVTDANAVDTAFDELKPQQVINCAGYTHVDRAESESEKAFSVNRDGPANLARASARTGAKLVHISTDFVFDGRSSLPYRTDAPTAPLGVYGSSKLAGEEAVLTAADDALIIRTAWLYSATGSNFVTTMLRLMNERDEIRVVDDQVGTPTHCRTLASAIWQLSERGASGIYHVTDAGVASWYDFAEAIKDEARKSRLLTRNPKIAPIPTSEYPTAARRPAYSVLDKSRTWAELGTTARHWRAELQDAMEELGG